MTTPAKLRVHIPVDITVDKLCDEFERQLKDGQSPCLDDFLSQVPETDRCRAFRELLLVELSYVPVERQLALLEHYLTVYPQLADLICRIWVAPIAAPAPRIEEPARCPHCYRPIKPPHADHSESEGTGQRAGAPPGSSLATPDSPRRLHHYRLLNELGEGSFGAVYRAFDTKLGRIVAVKVPRAGQLADSEQEMRFLREARSAGQLDHPGIIKVLDAGFCRETHYIVYDYFDGKSLAERISQQPLTPREAATLVCHVAEALEHAHEHQVIHRDLKTANILVNDQGTPKLTDFGLARVDLADISLTADGKVLGTPGYMSPEQAQGGAHYADRRSDIYSLGVILFELLTGERPFRGTVQGVLQQVINDDPPSPSSLVPSVHPDLEAICLKCLQKSPEARYATARALAVDLRGWLEGRPLSARPASYWPRPLRWVLLHKRAAALTLIALCLLAASGSVAVRSLREVRRVNRQRVRTYIQLLSEAPPDVARGLAESIAADLVPLGPMFEEELQRFEMPQAEQQRIRSLINP